MGGWSPLSLRKMGKKLFESLEGYSFIEAYYKIDNIYKCDFRMS
jgi:hypothetical protein